MYSGVSVKFDLPMTIFIRRKMQTIIKYKDRPSENRDRKKIKLHKTATTLNNWKRTYG